MPLPVAIATAVLSCCALANAASAQVVTEESLIAGGAQRLTTDEIRALHADRTVFHHNVASGLRVAIWYAGDGTRAFRGGNRTFTGEWTARDNQRCEETVAGPVVCMSFYRRGDELIVCDPREIPDCRWRITRSVEGDVEKLARKP